MSGLGEHVRMQELERRARAATDDAEYWAGALERAGDDAPPMFERNLAEAVDRAERLWLEYSLCGPEGTEPGRRETETP